MYPHTQSITSSTLYGLVYIAMVFRISYKTIYSNSAMTHVIEQLIIYFSMKVVWALFPLNILARWHQELTMSSD